jgi:hypothetical protein
VDRLGGLSDAIDLACERARVRREDVEVRSVPKPSVVEMLRPPESSEAPAAAVPSLQVLSPMTLLLDALGLPRHGVLAMPVTWRLR